MGYYEWPPYVPVAEKKRKAAEAAKKLMKKGEKVSPVVISGKKIATTFWGKAWCDHLESFSDYENRLPRGRTYVRSGYVIHLSIEDGEINALVQGSSLYKIKISITKTSEKKWAKIVDSCSGKIESIFELLQGKLSNSVMEVLTHKSEGLFPLPSEIKLSCSCPDGANMCKHVAAVMYGVGAKLDGFPELLFALRQVDQSELVGAVNKSTSSIATKGKASLGTDSLQSIFGIDIDENENESNELANVNQESGLAKSKNKKKKLSKVVKAIKVVKETKKVAKKTVEKTTKKVLKKVEKKVVKKVAKKVAKKVVKKIVKKAAKKAAKKTTKKTIKKI